MHLLSVLVDASLQRLIPSKLTTPHEFISPWHGSTTPAYVVSALPPACCKCITYLKHAANAFSTTSSMPQMHLLHVLMLLLETPWHLQICLDKCAAMCIRPLKNMCGFNSILKSLIVSWLPKNFHL